MQPVKNTSGVSNIKVELQICSVSKIKIELSGKTGSGSSYIFGTGFVGNLFATDSNDEDVPCTLYKGSNTASSVMIPGRKTCYAGWIEEYNGILASNAYNHAPSPYICVDANLTYVKGGQRDNEQQMLYQNQRNEFGSLPCPPIRTMSKSTE
ncbi:unnamed protein product [Mytilus edulis]|uniref:Uncharacterized protein n=1 Tax=Mytilus edulis TaxID=6550 RepID=A0A8S3UVD4_MYTED|nr:unnamed protein product [Mytilus edulis]